MEVWRGGGGVGLAGVQLTMDKIVFFLLIEQRERVLQWAHLAETGYIPFCGLTIRIPSLSPFLSYVSCKLYIQKLLLYQSCLRHWTEVQNERSQVRRNHTHLRVQRRFD